MGSRILVVEDEPAIAELIAINLEHAGHVALRAADVPEAEAHLRARLPDVVLLDWMLPGESGLAFARRLRADKRTRELPIILLTARAAEPDKVAGLDAGADDYLTKPFSTKELLARIKAVLRRRAPQSSGEPVEVAGLRLDPAAHGTRPHRVSPAALSDDPFGPDLFAHPAARCRVGRSRVRRGPHGRRARAAVAARAHAKRP